LTQGPSLSVLVLVSTAAHSTVVGNFESGLSGWDHIGDVSVQTSAIGLDPTQGNSMVFISTMCDPGSPPAQGGCDTTTNEHPYSGISSPDARYARTFLGLPFGEHDFLAGMPSPASSVGESGAIKTRFFVPEAGELSFDWNRIGTDPDNAYVSIWSDDTSFRVNDWIYSPTFSGSNAFVPTGVDLCARYYDAPSVRCRPEHVPLLNAETGWSSKSMTIADAGWYWIGFGLGEVADGTVPTVLALDNVNFQVTAVPEPETYAMWLLGIAGVMLATRRSGKARSGGQSTTVRSAGEKRSTASVITPSMPQPTIQRAVAASFTV
jgi:hypothetical protein